MVNLKIDDKKVTVPEGTTVMEAAASMGETKSITLSSSAGKLT